MVMGFRKHMRPSSQKVSPGNAAVSMEAQATMETKAEPAEDELICQA